MRNAERTEFHSLKAKVGTGGEAEMLKAEMLKALKKSGKRKAEMGRHGFLGRVGGWETVVLPGRARWAADFACRERDGRGRAVVVGVLGSSSSHFGSGREFKGVGGRG